MDKLTRPGGVVDLLTAPGGLPRSRCPVRVAHRWSGSWLRGLADRLLAEDGPFERMFAEDGIVERMFAEEGVMDKLLAKNGPLEQLTEAAEILSRLQPAVETLTPTADTLEAAVDTLNRMVTSLSGIADRIPRGGARSAPSTRAPLIRTPSNGEPPGSTAVEIRGACGGCSHIAAQRHDGRSARYVDHIGKGTIT